MVCIPGFIWGKLGVAVFKQITTGEEGTIMEEKKTRVSCKELGTATAEFFSVTIWRDPTG